jgi:hypothetical protein
VGIGVRKSWFWVSAFHLRLSNQRKDLSMNQLKRLYQWGETLKPVFPQLSVPQVLLLALFSFGMALAQDCRLRQVALALSFLGKPDTVERRLQRFLDNALLCGKKVIASQKKRKKSEERKEANERSLGFRQTCVTDFCRWVLSSLPETSSLVLLVDETSLGEHLRVMAISLAYRGRAIPLAWRCYHPQEWTDKQVPLILQLLETIQAAHPMGRSVLVQADRGIGTSPDLLSGIADLGWYYLMRVQGLVRLQQANGTVVSFSEMVPKVGSVYSEAVQAFKKSGWLCCRALGVWRRGQKEPWLLLTNCPEAQTGDYAIRMWEEEAFRDLKSSGWQWQWSHVYDPEHAERLWLVMSLAYVWMLSLGTLVEQEEELRREVTRGTKPHLSFFHLGLTLFLRWIARALEMPAYLWQKLHLSPQTLQLQTGTG